MSDTEETAHSRRPQDTQKVRRPMDELEFWTVFRQSLLAMNACVESRIEHLKLYRS